MEDLIFEFPCISGSIFIMKTILPSCTLKLTVTDGYSFITAINAVVYAIAYHKDTDSIISSFTSELSCDKVSKKVSKG